MFNSFLFNTGLFNSLSSEDGELAIESIQFENLGLQNANIVTASVKIDSTPQRSLDIRDVPRGDGRTILSDFYRTKTITMRGNLKASSGCSLDQLIDSVKKNLRTRNGSLKITNYCGEVREYKATLVNGDLMINREGYHITFVPFEFVFAVSDPDPFGKSVDYELFEVFDDSSMVYDGIIDNQGTYKTKPHIILAFTAADAVTVVNFLNVQSNQEIEITQAMVASDILEINSEEQYVRLNGVDIDYNGVFPEFETDESPFTLTITGNSATWTLTIKHKKTYL